MGPNTPNTDFILEMMQNSSKTNKAEIVNEIAEKLGVKDKLIVFYGFQGILGNKFSLLKPEEKQELELRIKALSDTTSPIFQSVPDFFKFYSAYNKEDNELLPIKVEDALNDLRVGVKLQPKSQEIDDVEEDEFDDDCTEECLPGQHACGK